MKTIKGRLFATVSAAAFIVLFIGAAAGATVVGSAGIGSAVGAGLLTGVLGTVVIDAAVSSVLGSALQPIAELKQFASGDFSEQSRMEAGTGVGDGFRDEAEEVSQAARTIRQRIRETINGTSGEAANIADTASAAYNEMAELNNKIDEMDQVMDGLTGKVQEAAEVTQSISDASGEIGTVVDDVSCKASESADASRDINIRADKLYKSTVASQKQAESWNTRCRKWRRSRSSRRFPERSGRSRARRI